MIDEIKNKVILIGNGFDLAHDIKSSYRNFIDDFWGKEKENILSKSTSNNNETTYNGKTVFFKLKNDKWDLIKNQTVNITGCKWFVETFKIIYHSGISSCDIEYKNKFLKKISEKMYLKNWADIEYEYYLALIDCVNKKTEGNIEKLNEEFAMIRDEFISYMKCNDGHDVEINHSIYKNIENIINPHPVANNNSILFINFNYTSTLTKYYEKLSTLYKNEIDCLYIHGHLYDHNNPIIFGYGDDIDEKYKLIENKNDNNYLANVKSIKYSNAPNYNKMLGFINRGEYEVYIMGLSCGVSDRTLLHTLFEHDYCKSINIFYYKNGDNDNFSDIVGNISRSFNNKELMRARIVDKTKCKTLS